MSLRSLKPEIELESWCFDGPEDEGKHNREINHILTINHPVQADNRQRANDKQTKRNFLNHRVAEQIDSYGWRKMLSDWQGGF